ncbi:MAG: sodium:solute symporter [Muribaculaceae bacterium]|nr:sodium:solute symporter [Muribaculaceae bacterium]
MIPHIGNLDIIIIIAFIAIILWWALRNRKNSDANDYFLAGKSQNWFVIGLSLFAASVSSSTLMGHSGEGFISGIAVFNYNIGAIFVIIFVALFFLPFYIKSGIYTIPEYLGRRFDNRSRKYFSFITIVGNVFLDAGAALYTGALILKIIFPEVDMMVVILIMAALAGTYTIIGGLSSAINADMIQSIVLVVGSVILSIFCLESVGGWEQFAASFHDGVWMHLVRSNDDTTVPWFSIIVSIPILGFYFWGNNQVMVQRVLSAKSVNEGRIGFLFVAFIYLFTLFIFITPGMIARITDIFGIGTPLPNEIIDGNTLKSTFGIDTNEVYPRLILKLLPVGLIGLMIACMVSALTSTLSASLNSISTLFTMDFYNSWKKNATSKHLVMVGQISSLVALVIAVLWAPLIGEFASLVAYYQEFSSYLAPPIVATFLMGLFWKRSTANGAFAGLMSGLVIAAVIMILKFGFLLTVPFHFLLWVPILLILSIIVNIIVSYNGTKPSEEVVMQYTWKRKLWREDSIELKLIPWYKNFRYISVFLVILALIEYWMFF